MTIEETIKHYETLKLKIAELENEADALKPALLEAIPLNTKVESEYGTITTACRTTYKFTDRIGEMEDSLKEAKKMEIANGDAEEIPGTPYLVFKARK